MGVYVCTEYILYLSQNLAVLSHLLSRDLHTAFLERTCKELWQILFSNFSKRQRIDAPKMIASCVAWENACMRTLLSFFSGFFDFNYFFFFKWMQINKINHSCHLLLCVDQSVHIVGNALGKKLNKEVLVSKSNCLLMVVHMITPSGTWAKATEEAYAAPPPFAIHLFLCCR